MPCRKSWTERFRVYLANFYLSYQGMGEEGASASPTMEAGRGREKKSLLLVASVCKKPGLLF